MALRDIAGLERFEELGRDLAEILNPADWLDLDEEERRVVARRVHDFVRMRSGLDVGDLVIEPLAPPDEGEYDEATDTLTLNELALLDDDPGRMLATLAHETRHALQFAVREGFVEYPHGEAFAAEVALWEQGSDDYDSADLVAYMYNPVETDARAAEHGVLIGYWKRGYELALEARDD